MNATQISAAKTSELIAFYNAHAAKPVAKFADRKTAERRVAELVASLPKAKTVTLAEAGKMAVKYKADKAKREAKATYVPHTCPSCGATADQTPAGLEGTAAAERNMCHHCGTEYSPESGKVHAAPAASASRSAAIAASWANPETAAKRAERTGVLVRGKDAAGNAIRAEYPSVSKAFIALGLPMSKHIKVRMTMKAEGSTSFEGFKFTAQ